MRRLITDEERNALSRQFPPGCFVVLDKMDDEEAPPIGTKGRVVGVDCYVTIHIFWENGSTLGVLYEKDACHRIA